MCCEWKCLKMAISKLKSVLQITKTEQNQILFWIGVYSGIPIITQAWSWTQKLCCPEACLYMLKTDPKTIE